MEAMQGVFLKLQNSIKYVISHSSAASFLNFPLAPTLSRPFYHTPRFSQNEDLCVFVQMEGQKANVKAVEEKADMRYCEEVFVRFGKEFDRAQQHITTLTAQVGMFDIPIFNQRLLVGLCAGEGFARLCGQGISHQAPARWADRQKRFQASIGGQ